MTWPLFLLAGAACAAPAWYWWRCRRRRRARQEQTDALMRLHLEGLLARQRLAVYRTRARQAIEAEVERARRELPWWWTND